MRLSPPATLLTIAVIPCTVKALHSSRAKSLIIIDSSKRLKYDRLCWERLKGESGN